MTDKTTPRLVVHSDTRGTSTVADAQRVTVVVSPDVHVNSRVAYAQPAGKIVSVTSSYMATLQVPFNVAQEQRRRANLQANRSSPASQTKTTKD
jgi:hypothetical protein